MTTTSVSTDSCEQNHSWKWHQEGRLPENEKSWINLNKFNNYDKANYIIKTHQGVFDATANHLWDYILQQINPFVEDFLLVNL